MTSTITTREVTCRRERQCSRCGAVIGRGDHYRRTVIPPWDPWADGRWITVVDCHDCYFRTTT